MVALSRCIGSLAVLAGATGARTPKKPDGQKTIANVPVLNYDKAYGGSGGLAELQTETPQKWNLLVQPGTSDASLERMCEANPKGCNFVGHPTGGIPFIELEATEAELQRVISVDPNVVKFIEPDVEENMIPEIQSDVGLEAATWGLNRIAADSRSNTGSGVSIYIADTGVRSSHEEFGGRASSGFDASLFLSWNCNGNILCARDYHGHGTHCAGTAGGATFGVAPSAQVVGVKVLGPGGAGLASWILAGVDFVTTSAVRPAVLSMSLGGAGAKPMQEAAVDAAVASGVVVVIAGGNSNTDACNFSPARVPSAVTVGSTDSTDSRSYFSNYGACTNIWAPGSDVLSAGIESNTASATLSGTSMACPHVAGAAALELSADPSLSASGVLENLLATASIGVISNLKEGDTNALLYVGAGGAPPSPTVAPSPDLSCPEGSSQVPWFHDNCACTTGLFCYNNGELGCPFWGSEAYEDPADLASVGSLIFQPSCDTCVCK